MSSLLLGGQVESGSVNDVEKQYEELPMSRRVHKAGGKYTGSHTTVIQEALSALTLAERCTGVKKISVGVINNAGHAGSPMRIAVRELPHRIHGVRMTVSKGALHQVFRLYLTEECTVDEITLQLEGLVGQSKKGRKKGKKRG